MRQEERLALTNQFKILAILDPSQAADYEQRIEILQHGFEGEYSTLFDAIYQNTLSVAECEFVRKVFEMYHQLQEAQAKHALLSDSSSLRFEGFDANYEFEYLTFCRYLVETAGLFGHVLTNPTFNSHAAKIDQYRRMLSAWMSAADRFDLTAAEVKTILAA
ncbi:YfbU family protein [Lacisediminimonas sp.]|uniref:YfbU family protein n=1 Tax=Lacisediminimonas sp. TaxID=3060582 RepID=UPI00271BCB69|nr:YfbU family protein [Lacisediminimonas sp.]MDO8299110.1 YfbU family protein [Lacisediminimonas sp.]